MSNRHKNAQGFYRPEAYFGLWSIVPERLNQYLAIVGKLDIGAMAAAALKSDTTPSDPLPTQKPDKDEQKKTKQSELAEKQGKHDEMAKDISEHEKKLQEKKDQKSDSDAAEIEKSEKSLDEKKKNHATLADEIEQCKRDMAEMEETDEGEEPEAAVPADVEAGSLEGYELHGDTAIITLSGPITKYPTSFQAILGGASTIQTQHLIRQANADAEVARIVLRIDSPGGTAAGCYELMREVKASAKTVWVYGDDIMASAAYFIGCNAGFIACGPTAMVGSVGTLVMLRDTSGMYQMDGIKVIAIGTGKHKGAGMDGTEITDEQRAYFQQLVDDTNSQFVADVKDSRKLTAEQLAEVCEAGVYVGQKAAAVGLVDAVMSFEEFLTKFEADTDISALTAAAEQTRQFQLATQARQVLAAVCEAVGCEQSFADKLFIEGKSPEQAKLARAEQILAEQALRQATGISSVDGQPPVQLGKPSDSVENEFMALVKAHQAEHKCNVRDAMSAITKSHPGVYEEYRATFQTIENSTSSQSADVG